MTQPPARERGVVADTGPLLCLAGAVALMRMYRARWGASTEWVEAVRDELKTQTRRKDGVGGAARRYEGRGAAWLPAPVAFAHDDPEVNEILAQVRAQASKKRSGTADLGEAQSLAHAARGRKVFLTHDEGARQVARGRRVRSATLVDLARIAVEDNRSEAKPLASAFAALRQQGLDAGPYVRSALDLHPRPR